MAKRLDEMSDEEISSLGADELKAMAEAEAASAGSAEETEVQTEPEPEANQPTENTSHEESTDDAGEGEQVTEQAGEASNAETEQGEGEGVPAEKQEAAPKADKVATDAVDYKSQVAALFAPFKANGRDIKVDSIEEARQLMQMGANYNKKMQAMRPHLATLRTLENAKIGEAELNFLIDVHNRVPAAINKLVQDSGIDPMDLSAEKAKGYTPQNHKAADSEVELDLVLNELSGSSALEKTIQVVSKEWDAASKQVIAKTPQLLKVINQHVESGIYDQIASRVDRERMLGRLAGLSDLEAYRQVGDAMHAKNEFVSSNGLATKNDQQTTNPPVIVKPNPQKADDSKRNEQKRGVAPVKTAAPAATNPDFNPLSLSDEEFAKKFNRNF